MQSARYTDAKQIYLLRSKPKSTAYVVDMKKSLPNRRQMNIFFARRCKKSINTRFVYDQKLRNALIRRNSHIAERQARGSLIVLRGMLVRDYLREKELSDSLWLSECIYVNDINAAMRRNKYLSDRVDSIREYLKACDRRRKMREAKDLKYRETIAHWTEFGKFSSQSRRDTIRQLQLAKLYAHDHHAIVVQSRRKRVILQRKLEIMQSSAIRQRLATERRMHTINYTRSKGIEYGTSRVNDARDRAYNDEFDNYFDLQVTMSQEDAAYSRAVQHTLSKKNKASRELLKVSDVLFNNALVHYMQRKFLEADFEEHVIRHEQYIKSVKAKGARESFKVREAHQRKRQRLYPSRI
ncbi:hypothetical protein PCE1_003067 [Barthelona sp. PCE]